MFENSHIPAIIKEAEAYCTHLLKAKLPPNLVFHNYHHTEHVVKTAQEIGINSGLEEVELQILAVAAWFHDTGYCNRYKGHEDDSMLLAAEFLNEQGAGAGFKQHVLCCIKATKHANAPQNLLEQVICDADLSHLGKSFYKASSLKLKEEIELTTGTDLTAKEWHRQNLAFLKAHTFFTAYARMKYDRQKNKNLQEERRLFYLQE